MKDDSNSIVGIDEVNLDKECINLPTLYLRHAHIAAEAKKDVGERKARLDVVEAELAKSIRSAPEKYGLDKVTEGAIKETITVNPDYRKAARRLREAQHQYEMTQAVVWALEHKKRSLTLLVELHGMSYFSNPKVSEKGREAVSRMTKDKVRPRHGSEES